MKLAHASTFPSAFRGASSRSAMRASAGLAGSKVKYTRPAILS